MMISHSFIIGATNLRFIALVGCLIRDAFTSKFVPCNDSYASDRACPDFSTASQRHSRFQAFRYHKKQLILICVGAQGRRDAPFPPREQRESNPQTIPGRPALTPRRYQAVQGPPEPREHGAALPRWRASHDARPKDAGPHDSHHVRQRAAGAARLEAAAQDTGQAHRGRPPRRGGSDTCRRVQRRPGCCRRPSPARRRVPPPPAARLRRSKRPHLSDTWYIKSS
jgi:hypothetical protein